RAAHVKPHGGKEARLMHTSERKIKEIPQDNKRNQCKCNHRRGHDHQDAQEAVKPPVAEFQKAEHDPAQIFDAFSRTSVISSSPSSGSICGQTFSRTVAIMAFICSSVGSMNAWPSAFH